MSTIQPAVLGLEWLWVPLMAVSVMILLAIVVTTVVVAVVVPRRLWQGRRDDAPTSPARLSLVRGDRVSRVPGGGSPGRVDDEGPRSFGEAAWGAVPFEPQIEVHRTKRSA